MGDNPTAFEDEDDEQYDAVEIPSDDEDDDVEETFQDAMRNVQMQKEKEAPPNVKPVVTRQPEVIDDFIRNFLVKSGLKQTLETFETEWYQMKTDKSQGNGLDNFLVPDLYLQNAKLEEQVEVLKAELDKTKEIAENARQAWEKLKKERNFHKMSHNRVVQEKARMVKDLKRLQTQCEKYDPTINELRHKYEAAMKEKMLIRLDRDKLVVKIAGLENAIKDLEGHKGEVQPVKKEAPSKKQSADSIWPSDDRHNPLANLPFKTPPNPGEWATRQSFKGHSMSVAAIALHPKTPACATVSDDHTWKLWTIPNGELIMSSGEHKEWVAGVDFHPRGTHLATGSGDTTVKLWDFVKGKCVSTFKDHGQEVWNVTFHDSGDFLGSCSADHTARIWDINSGRCRFVLRGHVDSVNSLAFKPYSNIVATCSADKTVSLWDSRDPSHCTHTFFGHENSTNSVAWTPRGDVLLSCDQDGKVVSWDIRTVQELKRYDVGPYPSNCLSIDRTGTYLAVASDDATIRIINLVEPKESIKTLRGHEDNVLQVKFDVHGTFLASCGADATWKIWG